MGVVGNQQCGEDAVRFRLRRGATAGRAPHWQRQQKLVPNQGPLLTQST